MLRIFFAPKIRRLRPKAKPANLGTKGQHATSRPPKPLKLKDCSRKNCYRAYKGSVNVCRVRKNCQKMKQKICKYNLSQNSFPLRNNKLSLGMYLSTFRRTLTPLSSVHYSLYYCQHLVIYLNSCSWICPL